MILIQYRNRIHIRSMACGFVPASGGMAVMNCASRHRALLPRHCGAVEAERQDDQATQQ
ncbi:hypothetical protein [Lysobacter sp. CW239]|uniref:hypothetical protein n=1 Tax=Lysobacter sp. CW239 TaxID=2762611 RepID=UPI000A9F7806|nr:hypothetical protein [Lysobacter sp. CW239]